MPTFKSAKTEIDYKSVETAITKLLSIKWQTNVVFKATRARWSVVGCDRFVSSPTGR